MIPSSLVIGGCIFTSPLFFIPLLEVLVRLIWNDFLVPQAIYDTINHKGSCRVITKLDDSKLIGGFAKNWINKVEKAQYTDIHPLDLCLLK